MSFAESLSEKERKRAQFYAVCSCLSGCVSEVMLDSSAIIIIYFTLLDGGDMLTMLGASFTSLMGALLYIPACIIITRLGMLKVVKYSCLTGCSGYLIMAAAPFFGPAAKFVALAGCLVYSIQRSSYGATWYPLLDVFLRPQDRARFFGMMRFVYTCTIGVLFFVIGLLMKKDPPIIFLQIVLAVTGLLVIGRYLCISKFPRDPDAVPENPDVKKGLSISMKNGPLTSYSVYICLLVIAFTSLTPLTYIYLTKYVELNEGTVQIISSVGLGGSMIGYFCYGKVFNNMKLKYLELLCHLLYTIVAFGLFAVDKSMPGFPVFAGIMIFLASFAYSLFMCNNSAELLALARPGNKTMAMAFVQTYSSAGGAIGRIGTSLILGTSMLAPVWMLGDREISRYQTFFLISGMMLSVLLFLLPTLPSFIPKHDDYYEPKK